MERLEALEYLKLSKSQAFWYNFKLFFAGIPSWILGLLKKLWAHILAFFVGIKDGFLEITKEDWELLKDDRIGKK